MMVEDDKVEIVDIILTLKNSRSLTNSDFSVQFSGHDNFL